MLSGAGVAMLFSYAVIKEYEKVMGLGKEV
jgi:hypothetical protein